MKASRLHIPRVFVLLALGCFLAVSSGQPQGHPFGQPQVPPVAPDGKAPPADKDDDRAKLRAEIARRAAALPAWFRGLDADADGQVSLFEWRTGGRKVDEFAALDRNADGFLTLEEVPGPERRAAELRFVGGKAEYAGSVGEMDELRRGKRSYTVLTVSLEAGRSYRFDCLSKAFAPYLMLEDPDGEMVAERASGNVGEACRMSYRAARHGVHRLVVTSGAGVRTGPFTVAAFDDGKITGLPAWFGAVDADADGQLSLFEWRNAGRKMDEFAPFDLNGDAFITEDEILRLLARDSELQFVGGKAELAGEIRERAEVRREMRVYALLTVQLEAGKSYRFDCQSKAFAPYLLLEDPDGEVVAGQGSPNVGEACRLSYRATRHGLYRLVAVSGGGARTGPFALTAIDEGRGGKSPPWFRGADADADGQLSLFEWRNAGRKLDEFAALDLNGDGFLTLEELLEPEKRDSELLFVADKVEHVGTVEQVPGEKYRGKGSYRILTVELEAGKSYRFEQVSPAFQSAILVEDAAGEPLAEGVAANVGDHCRLTHRATRTGKHRIVATSAAGYRTGPFTLIIHDDGRRPIPPWLRGADSDGDGQLSLFEWRTAGRPVDDFAALDRNADGFVTAEEHARAKEREPDLKFVRGKVEYTGTIETTPEDVYRGKVSYKFLTVDLQAGELYHFDQHSKVFQSFIYLEDPDREVAAENGAKNIGDHSRLSHRAERTGRYRIVATSLGGFRTGAFTISVRIDSPLIAAPSWFEALDADGDGQVSLFEWRAAAKTVDEFLTVDANNDGFITSEEVQRTVQKKDPILKVLRGKGNLNGTVEQVAGDPYRGKLSYQLLAVELEAGRIYHFDLISPVFQGFLLIEDKGEAVAEGGAANVGANCRVTYKATRSGTHRIVATSVGGFRTGAYALTVLAEDKYTGLPPWFEPLDADRDGQISLFEWRTGNRKVDDYLPLDANSDGYLTREEWLRAQPPPVKPAGIPVPPKPAR